MGLAEAPLSNALVPRSCDGQVRTTGNDGSKDSSKKKQPMSAPLLDIGRLVHKPVLRTADVVITSVDEELGAARGVDSDGMRCFIDHRSAVSISALHEGLHLRVHLTDKGLVKFLAEDDVVGD